MKPTGTNAPFSPGWCHQSGPKAYFQQPKGREAAAFGPGWWHQPGLMPPFSPGWFHQPGPKVPVLPASGPKFSPTSLVERGAQWFISPIAAPLSSTSPLQAYGPNCHCYAWWAYWAFCGPESWPIDGFLVVFRPWWPSRWHIFILCLFCFLFCFIYFVLFLLTTKNLFILFYFVSNYLFFLW